MVHYFVESFKSLIWFKEKNRRFYQILKQLIINSIKIDDWVSWILDKKNKIEIK